MLDRKCNLSNCSKFDKTSIRTKNWLIMKKDLQCDKCRNIKAICDGATMECQYSREKPCHLSDEQLSNNFVDNATMKNINCKLKSESTSSFRRSTTLCSSSDIHSIIRRRIVYAQVLLEAFGNASIPINSNSSRFVSFVFISK